MVINPNLHFVFIITGIKYIPFVHRQLILQCIELTIENSRKIYYVWKDHLGFLYLMNFNGNGRASGYRTSCTMILIWIEYNKAYHIIIYTEQSERYLRMKSLSKRDNTDTYNLLKLYGYAIIYWNIRLIKQIPIDLLVLVSSLSDQFMCGMCVHNLAYIF